MLIMHTFMLPFALEKKKRKSEDLMTLRNVFKIMESVKLNHGHGARM